MQRAIARMTKAVIIFMGAKCSKPSLRRYENGEMEAAINLRTSGAEPAAAARRSFKSNPAGIHPRRRL